MQAAGFDKRPAVCYLVSQETTASGRHAMADLFDNPIGLDGFEFVEFCAPEKGML